MSHWIRTILACGVGSIAAIAACNATDINTAHPLAISTLEARFGSNRIGTLNAERALASNDLAAAAAANPRAVNTATFISTRPLTASQLAAAMAEMGVLDVEARVPVGTRGTVYTIGLRLEGNGHISTFDALRSAETRFKEQYKSQTSAVKADAEETEFLAQPFRYTSANVTASNAALRELSARDSSLAVILQERTRTSSELDAVRRGYTSDSRNAGGAPGKRTDEAETSTLSLSLSEQWMTPSAEDAGRAVAKGGGPTPIPTYPYTCGPKPKGNGLTCPRMWVPAIGTGGTNARVFSTSYFKNSGTIQTGYTVNELRWGWYPTIQYGGQPSNPATAAFNSPWLNRCAIMFNGTSAPCDPAQVNGMYVPNATFEIEKHLPNPECTLGVRTGTTQDMASGCFVWTTWSSNLPSAYIDTTLLDDPTVYNASIGSANAAAINESTLYQNRINFAHSLRPRSRAGLGTSLWGQIGTRIPSDCTSTYCSFFTNKQQLATGIIVQTGD